MNRIISNEFKQVDPTNIELMTYNLWNDSSINFVNSSNQYYEESLNDSTTCEKRYESASATTATWRQHHRRMETTTASVLSPPQPPPPLPRPLMSSDQFIMMNNDTMNRTLMPINHSHNRNHNHINYNDNNIQPSQPHQRSSINDTIMNQMCTLYIDMSFDDRVFFGVHNFFILKCSLSESQCNVDFSATNNKVSIIGRSENVAKMCKSFFLHSTFALQFEFHYYDQELFAKYLHEDFQLIQKEYEKWDVYISYRPEKMNVILFSFLTFRKYFIRLIQAMINFQMQLEFHQLGRVLPNFMSTLQVPITRREKNLINSSYLDMIENETGTKIKLIRYNDCQHYPFENVIITGANIPSVMQARWLITTRFEYELKFHLINNDTTRLVKCISNLNYDRNQIEITISPCLSSASQSQSSSSSSSLTNAKTIQNQDTKIISIKTNEKYVDKIFSIHKDLIDSLILNGVMTTNYR